MPVYSYKGFDESGRTVAGTREAESPRTIKQQLRNEGVFLTLLNESGEVKRKARRWSFEFKFSSGRVSNQDLAVSTRQLSTLIGAGITLVESLTALVDQSDNGTLKTTWSDVKRRVNEGAGFADALSEHPRVFSSLYVNMVRAGESSGALDIVLDRLSDFTESQSELRSKLIGTAIYPAMMLLMALGVTSLLFVFVIPKITPIFAAQKLALPLPTRVLIGISHIVSNYWYVIVFLLLVVPAGLLRYVRTEEGRLKWDRFVLRAPLFGSLVRMIAIARFCKTLSTLLSSGVPLLASFGIVKNVVQNVVLAGAIATVQDCVKEGESIAAPLKRSGQFPPIVTHMVSVGERSGQLEAMLGNIAHSYEVQVDARIRAMTSIIEPLIIVVMGVVVAGIVFAILLPMLEMTSAI